MERPEGNSARTPVAIVGTACRAPGGVTCAEELWQVLLDGRDVVTGSDPGGRWRDGEQVIPADLADDRPLRSGAFLEGIDLFDPEFFGIPVREAPSVDPQHRLLMETTWEALEDAGIPPRSLAGSSTGMFVGISNTDYAKRFTLANFDVYQGISAVASGAPGRISYVLDVNGPSLAVDAACASSLVAVHLACRSLHDGETDLALAGGATVQLEWGGIVGFARAGALSARGRCAAFDAEADGFVRGEGCGMVVLKRLPDARRDGDRVLAVITGTAVNHAGRVQGITQPSRAAQCAVLTSAMRAAGIVPGDVGYVETHGTGTPVGDPIEFAALNDAYGAADSPCALGSIKTNIGHPESAAGVLGLIKAALAVRTGYVPANLHFNRWNPDIDADGTRFYVPTEGISWDDGGRPRRAAVSAFGVTGSNAHVIVEQAPCPPAPSGGSPATRPETKVYAVSAASPQGLAATCARIADHVDAARPRPDDVAHTLAVRRSHLPWRACVLAADEAELTDGLRALAAGRDDPRVTGEQATNPGRPVWVFSGHGSQWAGMGRDLLDRNPAFTRVIDRLEPVVAETAGFSVRHLLASGAPAERMDVVQPLVFAVQTGLAEMWRQWGVRPAAVVGHSMGEAAAAVAAGILSPEDGMRITVTRSAMLQRVAGGCMASVALPADQVAAEIADTAGVSVAVVTAPSSTVVAGHAPAVQDLLRRWQRRGVFCRQIAVAVAAHSPQVEPILDDLVEEVAWLSGAPPAVPFYSTSETPRHPVVFDAAYWARNLRNPVRFDLACTALIEDGHRLFLELSPHPLLTQAVEETAATMHVPVMTAASLLRDHDARETVCHAAARMHVAGAPVDLDAVNGGGAPVSLPPTAFNRARHWESPPRNSGGSGHMWLGERLAVHDSDADDRTRHVWSADLGTDRLAWLEQHVLYGSPVVPGAAYAELVLAAAGELLACPAAELRLTDVRFERLLPLAPSVPVQVSATATGDRLSVRITRHSDGDWERIAAATVTRSTVAAPVRPPLEPPPTDEPALRELYESFARIGLDTGPAFHSITDVAGNGVTRLRVPQEAVVRTGAPCIHPVLFDGCVLSIAAGLLTRETPPGQEGRPWLPDRIEAVVFRADPNGIVWTRCTVHEDGPGTATGRADLYDEDGQWVGALEGVHFVRSVKPPTARSSNTRLFEITWRQAPLPARSAEETAPDAGWTLISEPDDPHRTAGHLARALADHGVQATICAFGHHIDAFTTAEPKPANVVWCTTGRLDALERVTEIAAALHAHGQTGTPPRLWLVSRHARPVLDGDPVDPDVCAVRGLVRVASFEQPDSTVTWVDLDDGVGDAAAELLAGTAETEVAWRSGQRHVARMTRAPLAPRPPHRPHLHDAIAGEDEYTLRHDPHQGLDGLRLTMTGGPLPAPGPGQVLVRVQACTVHFRDVMVALGIYPSEDGRPPEPGSDATGVVVAVGAGVRDLRPGDHVTTVIPDGTGSIASHCLARADLTVPVPPDIDPAAIASAPLTYGTVWHCLHDLARLTAGETVLVHSAAGGTGLAAIAVARLLGATVIATAGTEAKRRHLREQGIEHVFDSRGLDFPDQVREATGGRGVDVVLNSLTGAAMRASLALLAPAGRFVEIGKRDLYSGARIDLALLRQANSYTAVDMTLTALHRPAALRTAMLKALDEIRAGRLPLLPTTVFPLAEAPAAFKRLASGDHIGRIVLRLPDPGQTIRAQAPAGNEAIRPQGAYIITGGTRGLGLEAARWLAAAGAGRIILGGRNAPTPEEAEIMAALRSTACTVEVIRGDIADPDTAQRLVAAAGERLRGVLHTAVVLDDAPLTALTPDRLARVWHPKVTGLQNLHHATRDAHLDWFVIFSSMAAMLGNPGQANYAAAGAWVDAFAQWRHHQGLPALSVNWGPWGQAGRATDFADRGHDAIGTAEGFATLTDLLNHRRVNTGVFTYQPELMFRAFPQAAQAPLLTDLNTGSPAPEPAPTPDTVRALQPGPARTHLIQSAVIRNLAALLGSDPASIPSQARFTDVGLDSLLAVALTHRIRTDLSTPLTPAAVWAHPTPAELAVHLDALLPPPRNAGT